MNQRKVQILEKNESVAAAIDGILDHLVTFAQQESIPIENLIMKDVFIGHNRHLSATIDWHR